MEEGTKGNGWQDHINKILKVVYEDGKSPSGSPHFATRTGKLISFNDTHIILVLNGVETGINKQKILRYEVGGDAQ